MAGKLLNKGIGIFLLRVLIGIILIHGTVDNILSWPRMLEFRDFLTVQGFPIPLACAVVSVYAQFICGVLFILGIFIRWAAIIMIINFAVASSIHISQGFGAMTPALMILFSSLLFLLEGPGHPSLHGLLNKRTLRKA